MVEYCSIIARTEILMCYNMYEPQGHCAKSFSKNHILYYSTYKKAQNKPGSGGARL